MVKEKRCGKLAQVVQLLHYNAPVHTARVVKVEILDCGFQELDNLPVYRPD